jgi:hypothetical protein
MHIPYFKIDGHSPVVGTALLYSFGAEVAIRLVGQVF